MKLLIAILFLLPLSIAAQTFNFRKIVENRLQHAHLKLAEVCPIDTEPSARRIFADYGAIFVSAGKNPLPAKCIFEDEKEVAAYRSKLALESQTIAGTQVVLQKDAMEALIAARKDAEKAGLGITPRGGTEASSRSFADTLRLWNSRFWPGLDHWVAKGKITKKDADAARSLDIPDQVSQVLTWENDALYFNTDWTKSILYSVAAPGASQHIFGLALDVTQFTDPRVRQILADHGWFQTVKSDQPHFTYIGVDESELPSLGLVPVTFGSQKFWIPDIK